VSGNIICNVQRYNPTPEQLAASMAGKQVATTMVTQYPDGLRPVDSPIYNDNAINECVPINMFGLANATPEGADYVLDDKKGWRALDQHFAELLLTGNIHDGWGAGPVSVAAGLTYREEWFDQYN